MSKLVKISQKLPKFARTCQILIRIVKVGQNLSKLVETCQNWSKLVKFTVACIKTRRFSIKN